MTSPEGVEEATRSLIENQPDIEQPLQQLVELDSNSDGWTFDQIPLDSGQFGELVSRDIAKETGGDTYQLADSGAVRRALEGTEQTDTPDESSRDTFPSFDWPTIEPQVVATVVTGLLSMVLVRSLFYNSVFRDGYTVSPGNDPYFYRYWQAQFLDRSTGLADLGILTAIGEQTQGRPLTHALNWWLAELLGGTPSAADTIAAWVPIVWTVGLGCVLYTLAILLTDDHRIAFASLLFLAVTPVHVVYTSLGFLEHRPYQYFWLGLLIMTLAYLAMDVKRRKMRTSGQKAALNHLKTRKSWVLGIALALAVTASAHTWTGSPLNFIPVALYFIFRTIADERADVPPVLAIAPTLCGFGFGGILSLLFHVQFGWHSLVIAVVPLLVTVGGLFVALLVTVWYRLELPSAGLLATEGILAVAGLWVIRQLPPETVSRLQERANDLFGQQSATETSSLFVTGQSVLLGPIGQIGLVFFFALPLLGIVTWYVYREYRPGWLVLVPFTWYYLMLAAVQVRFAAHLSILLALFGGAAFVYLLGALDMARKPGILADEPAQESTRLNIPNTRAKSAYLVGTVALILLFNLIFAPTLLRQTQYSDDEFNAMVSIDTHASQHEHTEGVLSRWGKNRMYNYFVSGESQSYGYARAHYGKFIFSENPDDWYDRNRFRSRIGYVVIKSVNDEVSEQTAYHKLFEQQGAGENAPAHYQLLYIGETAHAFAVVPGAAITTTAESGENVTATTEVTVDGESFTYERVRTATETGQVTIRVAYPGEYTVSGQTVQVTDTDVLNGTQITLDTS